MNTIDILLTQKWVQQLGWTLIQFFWQGTIISVLFAIVRGLLGRSMTAQARYILACCTLGIMMAAPLVTYCLMSTSRPFVAWQLPSPDALINVLPWLVAAWISGVLVFSIRLIGGWRVTARLRCTGIRPIPPEWQQKFKFLIERVGVSRPVQLLVSSLVEVPTVVGWLRPVVLMPVAALTGLPPRHVEALLAHELAHVRRLDYLLNLLQAIAETVLFYHPAVWWVSEQIRAEREICCDDLAIAASGDVLNYVRALAELESFRPPRSSQMLTANGGLLVNRILRLIGQAPSPHDLPGPGPVVVMSLLCVFGIGAMAANGSPRKVLPHPLIDIQQRPISAMSTLKPSSVASMLLFGPLGPASATQPSPTEVQGPTLQGVGTGAISGVVIDGSTNTPLAGVVVFLGPANRQSIGQPLNQLTDDKGRFVFTNLGPVTDGYYINATKFGYTTGHYGPGDGRQIPLADGDWFADARVVLYRPSAISGTITDELGDPIVGAYVRVLTQVTVGGGPHLASGPVAKTDDRGAYRIANLAAGKYVVNVPIVQVAVTPERAATPLTSGAASIEPSIEVDSATRQVLGRYPMPRPRADGRPQIYAPAFFPGVATPGDAQVINLKNAEDRQSVDIHLQPVSVVRVSGTVAGPSDALAGLSLKLLAAGSEELGDGSETATTMVGANGAFTFARVPSGHYTIEARWAAGEFSLRTDTLIAPPAVSLPLAPNTLNFSALSPSMDTLAPSYRTSRQMSSAYWGRARVDVADRDITGVAVTMQRGVTISGRGVADDPSAGLRVAGLAIRISLEPADGNVAMSATPNVSVGLPADFVSAETFKIEGVMPGQHFLRFVGLTVKSVIWNGRDMTNTPFNTAEGHDFADVVVTFTNKTTTLTGTVRDDQGRPAMDAVVIAFPVEREQWTNNGLSPPGFRATTPGGGGMFRQTSLPAGEYFVTAIGSDERDWRNPKFLQAASALATRVTLDWGETKTVDMKRIQVQAR